MSIFSLPDGFVFLTDVDGAIQESVRYYGPHNFLGRPAAGYTLNRIICTQAAAEHLKQAHDVFKAAGYRLVVYDGYRPQTAVNDFISWGKDLEDLAAKELYYPYLDKNDVFTSGYLATRRSTHSRGSTFDLTLIRAGETVKPASLSKRTLADGTPIPFLDDNTVDMGSSFDLFHEVSHHDTLLITPEQSAMRNILRKGMSDAGFEEYRSEWWHYTLRHEPFPDTWFDFIPDA